MIEILHGTHETVNFTKGSGFQMYDNTDFEEYPNHWHSELEIVMPLINSYTAIIGEKTYELREGDILVIGSGTLHHLLASKGERIILQPAFSLLHNVGDLSAALSAISPVFLLTPENSPEIHDKVQNLIMEMKHEYENRGRLTEAAIYYRLIEMFVLICRQYAVSIEKFDKSSKKQKEYNEKFLYICNYINEHYVDDLALDDIAYQAGFSKYHFERLFKNYTGTTFYKYLNQKRISQAEQLLVDPEISITEVALHSGFNNISTFIRMFKLVKGCTPTEFRSMYWY